MPTLENCYDCLIGRTIEVATHAFVLTCRHPSDEGGDSPPVEVKDEERKEIFATRQQLGEAVLALGEWYCRGGN